MVTGSRCSQATVCAPPDGCARSALRQILVASTESAGPHRGVWPPSWTPNHRPSCPARDLTMASTARSRDGAPASRITSSGRCQHGHRTRRVRSSAPASLACRGPAQASRTMRSRAPASSTLWRSPASTWAFLRPSRSCRWHGSAGRASKASHSSCLRPCSRRPSTPRSQRYVQHSWLREWVPSAWPDFAAPARRSSPSRRSRSWPLTRRRRRTQDSSSASLR